MNIYESDILIKEETPEEYVIILPYDDANDQLDDVHYELDPIKQECMLIL